MKLRAEQLNKIYRGRSVVKNVSLEVNQGEIVGLLGPNGAGKTTSFYMIVGLIKPNGGRIFLNDQNITLYRLKTKSTMSERSLLSVCQLADHRNISYTQENISQRSIW